MKFVLLSGFGIDLSWITDFIMETLITWISDLVASALDLFGIGLTSILGLDVTILEQMFPFMVDAYNVIRGFAMILMWTIAIFQLIRSMLGPMTDAEEPLKLIIRTALYAFFVYTAKDVTLYAVSLAKTPYAALQAVSGGTGPISFSTTQTTLLGAVGGTIDVLFAIIVTIILILIIAWNYFKLCLEAVERYAILGVLVYTSPLAFSMGPAQSTKNVFSAWIKMVGSQVVLMMSNVFFLRGFAYACSLDIGSFNQILANLGMKQSAVGAATLWCFLLIAWLKIGQRFDSYLNSLGLSVAQTGGNMGAELLATAHMVKTAYDSAKEGINKVSNAIAERRSAAGGTMNPAASGRASASERIGSSRQNSEQNPMGAGQRQSSDHQTQNSSVTGRQQDNSHGNASVNESTQKPGIVGATAGNSNESGFATSDGNMAAVNKDEKPVGETPVNDNAAESVFPGLTGMENTDTLSEGMSGDSSDNLVGPDGSTQDVIGDNTNGDVLAGNDMAQETPNSTFADIQTPDGTPAGSDISNMSSNTLGENGENTDVAVGDNIPHTGMPEPAKEDNGFVDSSSDSGATGYSQLDEGDVPVGMMMNAGAAAPISEDTNNLPMGEDSAVPVHSGGIAEGINSDGSMENPSGGENVSVVGGNIATSVGADSAVPVHSGGIAEGINSDGPAESPSGGENVSAVGGNIVTSAGANITSPEKEGASSAPEVTSRTEAVGIAGNGSVPIGNEYSNRMGDSDTGGMADNKTNSGDFAATGAGVAMNHHDTGMTVGGQEQIGDGDSKPIGDMSMFKGASIQATRQDGVNQMKLTNGCSSTSYSAEKYEEPHAPHTTIADRDGNLHYITQPTANYEMFDGLTPMQNMFNCSVSDAMDLSRAKNPDYSTISEGKFSFHGGMINGERVKLTAYDTALYSPKGIEGQDYFLRKDQNGSTWAFSKKRLHKYPSPSKRRR